MFELLGFYSKPRPPQRSGETRKHKTHPIWGCFLLSQDHTLFEVASVCLRNTSYLRLLCLKHTPYLRFLCLRHTPYLRFLFLRNTPCLRLLCLKTTPYLRFLCLGCIPYLRLLLFALGTHPGNYPTGWVISLLPGYLEAASHFFKSCFGFIMQ